MKTITIKWIKEDILTELEGFDNLIEVIGMLDCAKFQLLDVHVLKDDTLQEK